MINHEAFVLLAGNPKKWDDEIRNGCKRSMGAKPDPNSSDFFDSSDLCRLQVTQHARGRRSACLQRTMYGWSVRLDSGLDDRQILYGGRHSNVDRSQEAAIAFGVAWANEDPENREFYAYKKDVDR